MVLLPVANEVSGLGGVGIPRPPSLVGSTNRSLSCSVKALLPVRVGKNL